MDDELSQFIKAQQFDYERALHEIKRGKKTTHWIWYIFPQLKGLGRSPKSAYYGVRNLDEAKAYLADSLLGSHLIEICSALLSLGTSNPEEVMGPDSKKSKSSMKLFDAAAESTDIFRRVLDKYYQGRKDGCTLRMLGMK